MSFKGFIFLFVFIVFYVNADGRFGRFGACGRKVFIHQGRPGDFRGRRDLLFLHSELNEHHHDNRVSLYSLSPRFPKERVEASLPVVGGQPLPFSLVVADNKAVFNVNGVEVSGSVALADFNALYFRTSSSRFSLSRIHDLSISLDGEEIDIDEVTAPFEQSGANIVRLFREAHFSSVEVSGSIVFTWSDNIAHSRKNVFVTITLSNTDAM
jgi:hypothetical protein